MAESLEENIRSNAAAPKSASGDGFSAEQHPLPDQIAADRYLSSKAATRKKGSLGITFKKLVPPGTD